MGRRKAWPEMQGAAQSLCRLAGGEGACEYRETPVPGEEASRGRQAGLEPGRGVHGP